MKITSVRFVEAPDDPRGKQFGVVAKPDGKTLACELGTGSERGVWLIAISGGKPDPAKDQVFVPMENIRSIAGTRAPAERGK